MIFFAVLAVPSLARADPPQTERNSLPMMFTGIGLTTVGVIAVGVGTGLMIQGHQNCDRDAVAKTAGLSLADGAAVYPVANDVCVGESTMINGGLASIIGGSVFTAAGVAFTIAGAWKVSVKPSTTATAPTMIGVVGSF